MKSLQNKSKRKYNPKLVQENQIEQSNFNS